MINVFKNVIARGGYDLTGLIKNIDRYHVEHKLTDSERDELYKLARDGAEPRFDTGDEITRLWAAVRALQQDIDEIKATQHETPTEPSDEPESEPEESWDEYAQPTGAHDAYHIGDKVAYNGKRYICTMSGCVWAPDIYPAAWYEVSSDE